MWRLTSIAFFNELQKQGKEVTLQVIDTTIRGRHLDLSNFQALKQVLVGWKDKVRLVCLIAGTSDVRNMLIAALDVGMLNGNYAFVTMEFILVMLNIPQTYR